MGEISVDQFIAIIVVTFFAIGLHEYAHCKVADMAGDPTPGIYGRVTLNLTKHFELMGTLMMLFTAATGFGLGWGKPAPMDPRKMGNPRWDLFAAVAAGPISNLIQAIIWALAFRGLIVAYAGPGIPQLAAMLTIYGVMLNLSLCFFNLLPLGPLDGHWLVGQLLPEKQRYHWYKFNRQVGGFLLLGFVLVSQAVAHGGGPNLMFALIGLPVRALFTMLTGIHSPL